MHITEEEMHRRLNSTKNLVNKLNLNKPGSPSIVRKPMHKYTPPAAPALKILGASLAVQGEKVKDISAVTGLSAKQINSAKSLPQVQNTMEKIRGLALDKTLIALGLMTQEKFENAKLEDLAKTALACSKVAASLATPEEANGKVQFIIHVPQQKSLGQYRVVDV